MSTSAISSEANDAGQALWQLSLDSLQWMQERIQRFNIDCQPVWSYITVADRPRKARALRDEQAYMQHHHGHQLHWVEGAELRQHLGTDQYVAGLRDPTSGHLNPLRYGLGIAQAAQAAGLWVGTELTLFAQALSDLQTSMAYHPKVLAITGTNGKTTVTSLTGRLLERAGKRVAVAGNIGPTLLDTLSQALDKAAEEQAAADVRAAQEAATLAADEAVAEQARAELEAQEKAAAAQAAQMALDAEEALAQEVVVEDTWQRCCR